MTWCFLPSLGVVPVAEVDLLAALRARESPSRCLFNQKNTADQAKMVNVLLCIIAAVMFVAIVAANIYVLIYFQHEEDKNTAWFPKIITVRRMRGCILHRTDLPCRCWD